MNFLSLMHMQRVCQATTYTNTLTHKHNKWLTEAQVLSHHSWQDLCWWNQWRETHKGKIKVSEERNDIFLNAHPHTHPFPHRHSLSVTACLCST